MGQVTNKKTQGTESLEKDLMPQNSSTKETDSSDANAAGLELMLELSRWLKANCKAEGRPPKTLPVEADDIVVSSFIEIRTANDSVTIRNEIPFFSALASSNLPDLETDVLNIIEQMLFRPVRSYIHKVAEAKVQRSSSFLPEHALLELPSGVVVENSNKNEFFEHMPFDDDAGPAV